MRRKAGTLVPLEFAILDAALRLLSEGQEEAHGFLLAKVLRDEAGAKRLTAYGTLYRGLERLEGFGFLASRWEDASIGAGTGRPPRRFYRVTLAGERAFRDALSARMATTKASSRQVTT
ncbi:MAG: helix-turn-helix transcriptional regulator [Candidatus Limnocylindrales bacterium]